MALGELIYERMDRVIGQRVLSIKEEERPFFGPLTIHPEFWAKG
jgi:hypothetical protein